MTRLDLFATPVFLLDMPALEPLNAELSARLLEEEQHSPGIQRSNLGGWHSTTDLATRPDACFQALSAAIVESVRNVAPLVATPVPPPPPRFSMMQAWAMIMRNGDYTIVHDHGEAAWSTVYYVDAGDTENEPSAGLVFTDSRARVKPLPQFGLFETSFTIQPRAGMLVVFPGFLRHQVTTYQGTRPRISIAANVRMEAQPVEVERSSSDGVSAESGVTIGV